LLVILTDEKGIILKKNNHACDFCPHPCDVKNKCLNQQCHDFFHSTEHTQDNCPICRIIQEKKETATYTQHNKLTNKWAEFTFTTIHTEDTEATVVHIIHDITELKNKEQQLINSKMKADESNQLKTNFFANMSHELRTPLNGILGYAQLMGFESMSPEQAEYLSAITNSGHRLLSLVDELLSLVQIESHEFELNLQHFELYSSIQTILHPLETLASQKHLKLRYPSVSDDVYIYADPKNIKHVISCLIENAIKFTHEGEVSLDIETTPNNNKQLIDLTIRVTDTGIGMTKQTIKNIFDTFRQGDPSITRQYGGTGIGLSICQSLVEFMNGRIEVESQPSLGSQFSVFITVPYQRKKIAKPHELNKNTSPKKEALILVAEDDVVTQILMSKSLKNLGYESDVANNGLEVLEKLKDHAMILMDIQMPQMDGLEATKQIRKENNEIPIIALTAHSLNKDKNKAFEIGINAAILNLKRLYLSMRYKISFIFIFGQ
jgi:two-component system, sensor histidine kinase